MDDRRNKMERARWQLLPGGFWVVVGPMVILVVLVVLIVYGSKSVLIIVDSTNPG